MGITVEAIARTLDEIGAALTAGRARDVATLWEVPGLILADDGVRFVESRAEIETFFEQAIGWYREKGTPGAKPEIRRVDLISDRLAGVDVIWRALDGGGDEKSTEVSHYIMRSGDDGVPRVQVAMSRRSQT